MEDISLHILDIVENSIRAESKNIKIEILEDWSNDLLTLKIVDDGIGMNEYMVNRATDPFFTTKKGKRVGLGLSLLAQSVTESEGAFRIESEPNKGTKITAIFKLSNIDRKPLGDINETVRCLKEAHPEINFSFDYRKIE